MLFDLCFCSNATLFLPRDILKTNAAIVAVSYDFHSKTVGTYQKEAALPVRCKLDEE